MIRPTLTRRPAVLAAMALGVAALTAWPGSRPDSPTRAPEKSERRHVRNGPDSPDEALRYIQIAMRDENGDIDPNGLMNARREMDAMRVRAALQRQQAAATGAPADVAGIDKTAWTWIGPGNIGGRTRAIAIHPTSTNIIFAGSVAGGIWKSTDSGQTWSVIDDFMTNLAVTAIVFQPGNPSVMYAATGEGFSNIDAIRGAGIFKSVNGGTTWAQLASTTSSNFFFVTELAFSSDGGILLAATTAGIFRSTDGGLTFPVTVGAVTNVQDVKFLPGSVTQAVAGGRTKNAFFSSDGGVTWAPVTGLTGTSGTNPNNRVELGVSVSSPSTVYASVAAGGTSSSPNAELWGSTDSGHSYTLINSSVGFLGAQGWYDNAIWVDPTDVNHVLTGGVGLFQTTNGGGTLAALGTTGAGMHSDHHVIVSDPGFNGTSNKRVYFGNDGGLYKIESLGTIGSQVTTKLNNNYGVTQFYGASSVTSGKIFGGTQDNGTLLFTPANGPQAWVAIAGGDGGFASGDQTDPNFMYGEFQWLDIHRNSTGGISGSTDISCSSTKAAQYVIADCLNQTTNFISPVLLDPNNPNTLLGGGQQLWRTTDARTATTSTTGPTWTSIKPVTTGSSAIAALAVQTGNSNRIWVGHNNGEIWVTSNGTVGAPTWTRVDLTPGTGGPPDRAVTQISLDPVDPNIAYVSFGGFLTGNVWKTPNSGGSWASISGTGLTALPAVPVRSIVPHPKVSGWLYAGTDIGILDSVDGGTTWNVTNDAPANAAVFQLFWTGITGTTLVAVTHGRGMFTANVPGCSSPRCEMLASGSFVNNTINWGLPASSGSAGTSTAPAASSGWSKTNSTLPAAAGSTMSGVNGASTGAGAEAPVGWIGGDRPADAGPTTGGSASGWPVEASTTRREILQWADPIDLGGAKAAFLDVTSMLSDIASTAEVQVSFDGTTWETLLAVSAGSGWMAMTVDLNGLQDRIFYLRFVFDSVGRGMGGPPDSWRVDRVSITTRGGG